MGGPGAGGGINPSAGIQNMLLSPGNNDQQAGGGDDMSVIKECIDKLRSATSQQEAQEAVKPLTPIAEGMQESDPLKTALTSLISSAEFNWERSKQNENDATPDDMAQRVLEMINEKEGAGQEQGGEHLASNVFNFFRMSQMRKKKKKKTRGNPFRVLMGKVQKLLDHGLEKKDIVRHISRQGAFDEELIDRCVDIVKDYNRKEHRKEVEEPAEAPVTAGVFNYYRMVQAAKVAKTEDLLSGLYHKEPEWKKRSSGELLSRLAWLKDLRSYGKNTKMGDGKQAASKAGVADEIKSIQAALKERGFGEDEIEAMS